MSSGSALRDLKELVDLEVKIRLLDAEGIEFPNEAPPLPPPPSNFHFATA